MRRRGRLPEETISALGDLGYQAIPHRWQFATSSRSDTTSADSTRRRTRTTAGICG